MLVPAGQMVHVASGSRRYPSRHVVANPARMEAVVEKAVVCRFCLPLLSFLPAGWGRPGQYGRVCSREKQRTERDVALRDELRFR